MDRYLTEIRDSFVFKLTFSSNHIYLNTIPKWPYNQNFLRALTDPANTQQIPPESLYVAHLFISAQFHVFSIYDAFIATSSFCDFLVKVFAVSYFAVIQTPAFVHLALVLKSWMDQLTWSGYN